MSTHKARKGSPVSSSSSASSEWYDVLRYHLIPPSFLIIFTAAVQYLAWMGRGELDHLTWDALWGNSFSWKFVAVWLTWAYISLVIPSAKTKGPVTDFGQVPIYQDNGVLYYWATLGTFVFYNLFIDTDISVKIYDNFPYILGCSNTSALTLCTLLLVKGRMFPDVREKTVNKRFPIAYEFYSGKELHPRLLGVDVKQWTNCRIGMISWQILVLAFYFASIKRHQAEGLDFNHGFTANVLLQSIYVAKFWWWEAGYFWTLDIILDRAGYYLCWGCMVWLPIFYTFSSYFLVAHPPQLPPTTAWIIFAIGVAGTLLNYQVDREKEIFRKTDGNCNIWGSKATYLSVEYYDEQKNLKKSKLLTCGFWGTLRHFNYDFELVAAYSWCGVAGFHYGVAPFIYALFLTGLLVHRVFRDEEKCRKKYGKYWDEYCKLVPYRMIPYVF